MTELKLIALDAEDLNVISAHVQDAVLRIGDMAYLPRERRFALVLNRFDWTAAVAAATGRGRGQFERRRAGLRFERVMSAKVQGFDLKGKTAVLALLAVGFEPTGDADAVEGDVTLTFSGGAAIRLHVECLEVELKDLGAVWATAHPPEHPDGES